MEAGKNILNMLKLTMESWDKNLICSNADLAAVKIKPRIFQGGSLLPLLFVVSLLRLKLVFYGMKQGYSFGKGNIKLNHLLFMDEVG